MRRAELFRRLGVMWQVCNKSQAGLDYVGVGGNRSWDGKQWGPPIATQATRSSVGSVGITRAAATAWVRDLIMGMFRAECAEHVECGGV